MTYGILVKLLDTSVDKIENIKVAKIESMIWYYNPVNQLRFYAASKLSLFVTELEFKSECCRRPGTGTDFDHPEQHGMVSC